MSSNRNIDLQRRHLWVQSYGKWQHCFYRDMELLRRPCRLQQLVSNIRAKSNTIRCFFVAKTRIEEKKSLLSFNFELLIGVSFCFSAYHILWFDWIDFSSFLIEWNFLPLSPSKAIYSRFLMWKLNCSCSENKMFSGKCVCFFRK